MMGADNNAAQQPKRVVGKPFAKGVSGNPGGRPPELKDVQELARTHTADAIRRLAEWARSDNPKASPAACVALLNRAWGMPTQPQEHTGKDGGPIQHAVEDARPGLDLFLAEFTQAKDAKIGTH